MAHTQSEITKGTICPHTSKLCPLANGGLWPYQAPNKDHVMVWALKTFGWVIPSLIGVLVAGGFLIKPATQASVDQMHEQFSTYVASREKEETTRSKTLETILSKIDASVSDMGERLRSAELWQAEMGGILRQKRRDASDGADDMSPAPPRRQRARAPKKQENSGGLFSR